MLVQVSQLDDDGYRCTDGNGNQEYLKGVVLIMMLKKSIAVLLVLSLFTAVVGCSNKAAQEEEEGVKEITITLDSAPGLKRIVNQAKKKFEEENKNVQITIEEIRDNQYRPTMEARHKEGNPSDIMLISLSDVKDYSDNDIVLDLNGFLRQDNVDQEETFFNFLLDMSTYNGKLTGIPIAPEVWFIVYNEKRFQDAGIPEPSENWTWEELADAGKRLKAAYGGQSIYNPIMLPFDAFTLENLIASNGGSILSDDGQTAQGYLNSDASVQAVEWVVDLVVKDQLAKPSTLQDLVNLFANTNKALLNQSSIYIVPTSFKSFIPADKGFKIASLPYFANGERVNIPNMMSFGISSKSKYPEVAWDFLKELTFNDTEITRSMVKYNLNSTKTIIGQFMDDPIIKTSYREFEYARIGSMYKNRNFLSANRNKISPALRDLIYSANNGENVNVKESLSEIARDIEADLKEEEYIPFQ